MPTLGPHLERLVDVRDDLPASIEGVIYANELLDAFPVHVVTMTAEGIREIVVSERDGVLVEAEAGISDPAIVAHLPPMDAGARMEVGLAAASLGRATPPRRCGAVSCCSSTTGTSPARRIHARIPKAR